MYQIATEAATDGTLQIPTWAWARAQELVAKFNKRAAKNDKPLV